MWKCNLEQLKGLGNRTTRPGLSSRREEIKKGNRWDVRNILRHLRKSMIHTHLTSSAKENSQHRSYSKKEIRSRFCFFFFFFFRTLVDVNSIQGRNDRWSEEMKKKSSDCHETHVDIYARRRRRSNIESVLFFYSLIIIHRLSLQLMRERERASEQRRTMQKQQQQNIYILVNISFVLLRKPIGFRTNEH